MFSVEKVLSNLWTKFLEKKMIQGSLFLQIYNSFTINALLYRYISNFHQKF